MAKSLGRATTILILAFLLGCDGTPTQPDLPPTSPLVLAASARQSRPGDDVTLQLALTNRGLVAVEVSLYDGCEVNYFVSRPVSSVWNSNNHAVCTLAVVEFELRPGETRHYTKSWDLTADDGSPVQPGVYSLRGALRGPPIESPAVSFVVE